MELALSVTDQLRELERQLLQPEARASRAELDALLAEEFMEFGASGRIYNKASAIDVMCASPGRAPISMLDFAMRQLAEDVAMVTYRAVAAGAPDSLRSSLWMRRAGHWRIVFHQGTPAA